LIRQKRQELNRWIDQAYGAARAALPHGSDEELEAWIIAHRWPAMPSELRHRLGEEALKDLVLRRVRRMGIVLAR
jgi:hypothetical protein